MKDAAEAGSKPGNAGLHPATWAECNSAFPSTPDPHTGFLSFPGTSQDVRHCGQCDSTNARLYKGWGHLSAFVPQADLRGSAAQPSRHHSTLDVERWALDVPSFKPQHRPFPARPSNPRNHHSPFDVQCSMFDVHLFFIFSSSPQPSKPLPAPR